MPAKRILLIENDSSVSAYIKTGLESHDYAADIAYDGIMGKSLALSGLYDLILLDIKIPLFAGFQLCRIIRENNTQIPIILLSATKELEDKLHGFDCGADDYLAIPLELEELMARIKVFLKRNQQIPPKVNNIRIADLEIDHDAKTITRGGNIIELSSKEYHLLEYLVHNEGKVVSRSELIEKVWGKSIDLNSNVVDVYINFLRNKMDSGYTSQLIHTRVGLGYVLKDSSKNMVLS